MPQTTHRPRPPGPKVQRHEALPQMAQQPAFSTPLRKTGASKVVAPGTGALRAKCVIIRRAQPRCDIDMRQKQLAAVHQSVIKRRDLGHGQCAWRKSVPTRLFEVSKSVLRVKFRMFLLATGAR
jgi:hypothetical protein